MKRIAMITNGLVVNVSDWDGVTPWHPGDQYILIDVTGTAVGPGWTYDGHDFHPPQDPN